MKIEFCPRCGTKRPDELQWCRKCGLDFEKAERGKFPPGMTGGLTRTPPGGWAADRVPPPTPAPPGGWAVDRVPPPSQTQWQQPYVPKVEVRPMMDRQSMARWTANALDVRCGGTAAGCLGMIVGFFAGGSLGIAIGSVAILFTIPLGVAVGWYLGVRLAMSLMAR